MSTLLPRVTRLTAALFLLVLPARFFAQNTQEVYDLYVYDALAKAVPGAEVDLSPCGQGIFYTGSDGALRFVLPPGADCYMTVRKQGMQEAIYAVRSAGPHQISVGLEPDRSGQFSGLVFDGTTGAPMANAVVYARSNKDNHWTRASTDGSGRYVLRLNPLQEYTITYAQYGYEDMQSTVQTAQYLSGVIALPEAELRPGVSVFMLWLAQRPSGSPATLAIGTYQPGDMDGFSIQLASGLVGVPDAAKRYGELADYGNLYLKQADDGYQLRLGVYATKRESQAVVNKILPKYPGALAVAEPGVSEKMFVLNSPFADQAAAAPAATAPVAATSTKTIYAPQEAPAQYSADPTATLQFRSISAVTEGGPPPAAAPAVAAPAVANPPVLYPKVVVFRPHIRPIESSVSTSTDLATPVPAPVRYAVQVGSFSADRAVPVNQFAVLRELGPTYARMENGALKVRLGVWNDHELAETARDQAVQRGFRDATIVTEESTDPGLQAAPTGKGITTDYALIPSSMLLDDAAPAQYSTPDAAAVPTVEEPSYYIRIAALSNPGRFDPQPYQDLGNFEMRPLTNGMTLVLLGRYLTPEDALAAQGELRRRGYKEPYAVRDDNGTMEKIR